MGHFDVIRIAETELDFAINDLKSSKTEKEVKESLEKINTCAEALANAKKAELEN